MGRVVIWKRELGSEIHKVYRCTTLPDIKGYALELSLSDEILDILEKEKDHRTPALMVEDAQDACAATVQEVVKRLKMLDGASHGRTQEIIDKLVSAVKSQIDTDANKLAQSLKKVPEERWKKWTATRKEYTKYKIDTGVKLTLGTLGAVGSGLAIAAAVPTGGASLALGIVGGAKSGLELCKMGVKLWVEAETIQKKVILSMVALQKVYKDTSKKSHAGGAKEAGMALFNAVLPLELAPTISVLSGDVDLWHKKLAGIEIVADKKAKLAMGMLKQADELGAMLKKSKSKDAGKIMDKLTKLRKSIDQTLTICTNEAARVRDGRKVQEHVANTVIPQLKAKQPLWTNIFDKAMPTVINLALTAGGTTVGVKEAQDALQLAQTWLDFSNSILSEIKAQLENALG